MEQGSHTPLNQVGFPREYVVWTNPNHPQGKKRRISEEALRSLMLSSLCIQCALVDADMELLKKKEKH